MHAGITSVRPLRVLAFLFLTVLLDLSLFLAPGHSRSAQTSPLVPVSTESTGQTRTTFLSGDADVFWVGATKEVAAVRTSDGMHVVQWPVLDLEDIAVDNARGVVWAGTSKEITKYKMDGTELFRYALPVSKRSPDGNKRLHGNDKMGLDSSQGIREDDHEEDGAAARVHISPDPSDGSLWVGGQSELLKISFDGLLLLRRSVPESIADVSIDIADSSCWVGLQHSAVHYSSDGQILRTVRLEKGDVLSAIAADPRMNAVWVGTKKKLIKIDRNGAEQIRTGEPHDIVALRTDPSTGTLWFITNKEAFKYDALGQKLLHLRPCPHDHARDDHEGGCDSKTSADNERGREDDDARVHCDDNLVALAVNPSDGSSYLAWRKAVLLMSSEGALLRWFEGFKQIEALDAGLPKLSVMITVPENGSVVETASMTVKGSISDPGAKVAVNGRESVVSGRTFEAREVPLTTGENTITATAVNLARLTSSATITVVRRSLLPALTVRIASPKQGDSLSTSRVTVTGTVNDPSTAVVVNGVQAVVSGTTFAAANVPLVIGNNAISAYALDPAGRSATDTVTVTYTWLTLSLTTPEPGQLVPEETVTATGLVSDPGAYVVVNGREAMVTSDGLFSAAGIKLVTGWNDIAAQATNREGQVAAASLQVQHSHDTSGYPVIQVLAPPDRAMISAPTFTVFGTVSDPTAVVIVNDVPAQITGNLFSAMVYACDGPGEFLYEGAGGCIITVSVYTKEGESVTIRSSYTYDPRQDPLRVNITSLPRESTTTASVVEVRGDVHNAPADILPAWVRVNDTWAEVSGSSFIASVPLNDGTNYLTVRAENLAGEQAFDTVQIIYESPTKPLWVAIYNPVDGSIVNRPEIAVSGYVSDSTAAVIINGLPANKNTWTFSLPAVALSAGENLFTATATRPNGENASSTVSITYDPNYPSPPAPQLAELPAYTRSAAVEIVGVAQPMQTVGIFLNGALNTNAKADSTGLFKALVENLQEGPNHITARTGDAFKNMSAFSNVANTVRDTIPPAIRNVQLVMQSLNLAVSRVSLLGGTEPLADIEINIDEEPAYTSRTTADAGGMFYQDLVLSAGRHFISIIATDLAGNKKSYGRVGSVYARDTSAQIPPRLDPLPSPITGTSVTVEGNAYARFEVELYRNNELVGAAVADQRGRFRFENVNLVPGTNILKARQMADQVDTGPTSFYVKSADSAERTIEVVSGTPERPAVKIDFPRDGSVTNAGHIPLRGTVSVPNSWVTVNGSYYSVVTGAWNTNGRFTSHDAIPLLPGPNILWVEAFGPNGSRGVDKITVTYQRDAGVPAIAITTPPDSGEVYSPTVDVSGTVGPVQKVIVNEAEAVLGSGDFAATIDILSGAYTYLPGVGRVVVTAWAMDEAGRIGHHEVRMEYKYVPVPVITITAPAEGQVLNTPTAVISGTVSHASELSVNGRPVIMSGGAFSMLVDLPKERNSFNIIAKNGPRAAATTLVVYYYPASQVSLQSVALTPDPVSISLGKGRQVTATGTYTDGRTVDLTRSCNWASSDETVVVVNAGYVQSKRWGRTTVTAQCYPFMNEVRVAVNERVIEEVRVAFELTGFDGKTYYAFDNPRRNPGEAISFRAVGYYANGVIEDLTAIATWTSSNPAVAAPDKMGSATALSMGSASITGTYNEVSGSSTLTVIPPVITLIITSPSEGNTTDKDRITVSGAVFSKATEAGVRVNGKPATVSRNQFVANQVPVPEGNNVITVDAEDTNGATAQAKVMVNRVVSGNPLRLAASIESGIAPLETVIRIDGVPTDAIPDIKASGTGTVEFVDCASTDSCKIKMATEGVYTITVTSVGYDGNTYSDSIAITVLDRVKLDALLKAKWEGMKAALAKGDVEGAVSYFTTRSQERYRGIFTALSPELSDLVNNMQSIQLIYVNDGIAKYRIRKNEIYGGQMITVTYYIYYVKDIKGAWLIDQF